MKWFVFMHLPYENYFYEEFDNEGDAIQYFNLQSTDKFIDDVFIIKGEILKRQPTEK